MTTVQLSCVYMLCISADAVPLLRRCRHTVLAGAGKPLCLVGYTCAGAFWGMACTHNSLLPSSCLHRHANLRGTVLCPWRVRQPVVPRVLVHCVVLQCNPASCQCSGKQVRHGPEPWHAECLSTPADSKSHAGSTH